MGLTAILKINVLSNKTDFLYYNLSRQELIKKNTSEAFKPRKGIKGKEKETLAVDNKSIFPSPLVYLR